jgi:ABC-type transporter Mla MlaB component
VLKITVDETDQLKKFSLEGKLSGPWVKELARVWLASDATSPAKPVAVDICGVTFVDSEGQQLLARMYGNGVKLQASGCMNRSIVERIERAMAGDANGSRPNSTDE